MFLAKITSDRAVKVVSDKKGKEREIEDLNRRNAGLLWRTLLRQPEYIRGELKLERETTIRQFLNSPNLFLNAEGHTMELNVRRLASNARSKVSDLDAFVRRVVDSYKQDISHFEGAYHKVSMDILISTLEVMGHSGDEAAVNKIIEGMVFKSGNDASASMIKDLMARYIKIYSVLKKGVSQFRAHGYQIKDLEEKKDAIIQTIETALEKQGNRLLVDARLLVVDSIYKYILAESKLAANLNCGAFVQDWAASYGFAENEIRLIGEQIDLTKPLMHFLPMYYNAIKTLGQNPDPLAEINLYLLRNYYVQRIENIRLEMAA